MSTDFGIMTCEDEKKTKNSFPFSSLFHRIQLLKTTLLIHLPSKTVLDENHHTR